jgi:hypothetical protein
MGQTPNRPGCLMSNPPGTRGRAPRWLARVALRGTSISGPEGSRRRGGRGYSYRTVPNGLFRQKTRRQAIAQQLAREEDG